MLERKHVRKLLRLPGNALSMANVHDLGSWGSYKTQSMIATCLATIIRAAHFTLNWIEPYNMIISSAEAHLPIAQARRVVTGTGQLCAVPLFWEGISFAEQLKHACFGFACDKRLHKIGAHALHAMHMHVNAAIASKMNPKKGVQGAMTAAIHK